MRIRSLHFYEVGPLGTQIINLENEWDEKVEQRALFSGPNGCGKSTVLRAAAMLWEAFGYWLDHRKTMPRSHSAREWLQKWGSCAVIIDGLPNVDQSVGLIFGDAAMCEAKREAYPFVLWIGESVARTGRPGNPERKFFMPPVDTVNKWSESRKKMILSFEKANVPNMLFLDAEERRWVSPRRNVGEHVADQPVLRWLPRYIANDDWKGQLEASLITLKTTQLQAYHKVVRHLNEFLSGKEIDPDIRPGENRLLVKIAGQRGATHSLDELSAGEHQVLILIYLISRWAEKGCVVMIDEPDLYLHPSLVSGLLASLEKLVSELDGQLIITSHQPDIWHRYESSGKRIELRAKA
jgi:predicted ATPase